MKVLLCCILFLCFDVSTATHSTFDPYALSKVLSPHATISGPDSAPRWSEFDSPVPLAIVNVASEHDVLLTVKFASELNISFLAQNGGNGWSTTLDKLNHNGIIINLAGIKAVTFNSNKTEVTMQGGALVSDTVAAGATNNALIPTGICNCIGTLGAVLGGGVGNLMGMHGLGVDNLLSVNLVTPAGKAMMVSPQTDPQLWFALRGAGPNFGIVTSATMKSYPVANTTGLNAWLGALVFTSNQLETLIQAIDQLDLQRQMAIELLFTNSGNTSAPPIIILSVFYYGTEAEGKAAYAPIYAIGPVADETAITPYTKWNAGGDAACVKGGRKPNFAAGLARMDPATWRAVYQQLSELIQQPGAENSSVLMNAYPLATAQSLAADDAAYPFRKQLKYNAVFTPTYADASFDPMAEEFGFRVRDLWRATSGLSGNQTYINNGYGDESLETVYGQNLQRLQGIKQTIDPQKRFNFWFPLS